MPIKEHLKGIVFIAAAKAEAVIHTYPTHFHDIEEAKEYIRATCKQAGFQYVSKRIKHEEFAYVKDKVCFVVAAKAFEQGEFYLEIELGDRRALRAAVEADIRRLLVLVPYWPSRFSGLDDARDHVDGVARWKQFAYTKFEGVEQRKFRNYVNFNAVRHAFEAGRFDMDVPVEGWRWRQQPKVREQVKKVVTAPKTPKGRFATLKEAIEFDMQRLLSRISWPTIFPSLNAARDYVFHFTQSTRFTFTYRPELEPGRYRLFVNYNTAKRAFESAKFKVDDEEDVDVKSNDTDETAVESTEIKERNEVSMLAYNMPSTGSAMTPTEIPVFSATTAFSNAIDSINTPIATTNALKATTTGGTIPASLSDEPSQCESSVQEIAQEITMPPVVEVDEDPFKDLIATLQRKSILKMAFE